MEGHRPEGMSRAMLAAAHALRVDTVTAEVCAELVRDGVPAMLLKGPVLARALYGGGARAYSDTDILVPEPELERTGRALARLGFRQRLGEDDLVGLPLHAYTWVRDRDRVVVDVHRSIKGARASASAVWEVFQEETATADVGGARVTVPGESRLALMVALHAAQHGIGHPKPLEDLRRALERFDDATWEEARTLAERLDATPAFATGLRLVQAGAGLAERMGLSQATTVDVALFASSPPPLAVGFKRLAEAPGLRAKAHFLARKVLPTRRFMRGWSPLARRGPAGLVLAYLWRPLWLLRRAGPGLRAWRRARRVARG